VIYIDLEKEPDIKKVLDSLGKKSRNVVRDGVNKTLVHANEVLAERAMELYVLRAKSKYKGKVKKATLNKNGYILYKGDKTEIKNFKATPMTYYPGSVKNGKRVNVNMMGRVLQESALKSLSYGGNKSFVVKFSNGHISVVRRNGKKMKEKPERDAVEKILSPDIPGIMGGIKVYSEKKRELEDHLEMSVRSAIKAIADRRG
jgi:hypothetical protein